MKFELAPENTSATDMLRRLHGREYRLAADEFSDLSHASPDRLSLMLDFSPSEFSRLRLQYAYDEARRAERDHQVFLQYLYSIGAHGAHKF